MNILFIEDDPELSKNAVIQLEEHGNAVTPVSDLASARAVLENPNQPIKLVIADHQLPDGMGIPFVEEMKVAHPGCIFIVVSGMLTSKDIVRLDQAGIPFFHKPLLYGKIVDEYRRLAALQAPVRAQEPEAPEPLTEVEPTEKPSSEVEATEPQKKKKWFGLFGGDHK